MRFEPKGEVQAKSVDKIWENVILGEIDGI